MLMKAIVRTKYGPPNGQVAFGNDVWQSATPRREGECGYPNAISDA
jgi:hypothetical protein